jgi:mannose-6-phosphate isomerase-like protein (cupin superfamily)
MYHLSRPTSTQSLAEYFALLEPQLAGLHLTVSSCDPDRPWGGFLVFPESQASQFAQLFFPDTQLDTGTLQLSPKLLVVRPGTRLSWQYHHRRSELWRPVLGPVGVATSPTDSHGPVQTLETGTTLSIPLGVRHRLVGLDNWGVVAEIWQHTVPGHPSDETDIVRLSDDFGRGTPGA